MESGRLWACRSNIYSAQLLHATNCILLYGTRMYLYGKFTKWVETITNGFKAVQQIESEFYFVSYKKNHQLVKNVLKTN